MPLFIPKTKFADYLQFWALNQEIPVWTSAELQQNPTYDKTTKKWTIKVIRDGSAEVSLRPRHLVMATGMASRPKTPVVPGAESFKGTLMHSHAFKNANEWKGKKVIVVGAVSICVVFWLEKY